MSFTLNINGEQQVVDVDGDTPLLWVLRDSLGLTGAKFGCGIGYCGACTVHIDGVAMRSCMQEVDSIGEQKITTLEGLSEDGVSHPVQAAWIAEQVPQCGYCQPGMIMEAAALLAENDNPSDADIAEAMNHICRCGTYNRLRAAIKTAAKA